MDPGSLRAHAVLFKKASSKKSTSASQLDGHVPTHTETNTLFTITGAAGAAARTGHKTSNMRSFQSNEYNGTLSNRLSKSELNIADFTETAIAKK